MMQSKAIYDVGGLLVLDRREAKLPIDGGIFNHSIQQLISPSAPSIKITLFVGENDFFLQVACTIFLSRLRVDVIVVATAAVDRCSSSSPALGAAPERMRKGVRKRGGERHSFNVPEEPRLKRHADELVKHRSDDCKVPRGEPFSTLLGRLLVELERPEEAKCDEEIRQLVAVVVICTAPVTAATVYSHNKDGDADGENRDEKKQIGRQERDGDDTVRAAARPHDVRSHRNPRRPHRYPVI